MTSGTNSTASRAAHDRRPAIVHNRSVHRNNTGFTFDRRLLVPSTYPTPTQPFHLRVHYDTRTGLTSFADERVSSELVTGEPLHDEADEVIVMSREQVRWLARTVERLVATFPEILYHLPGCPESPSHNPMELDPNPAAQLAADLQERVHALEAQLMKLRSKKTKTRTGGRKQPAARKP